ncbi:MAG: ABC transporter ATP-binding protein, partial [Parachlamydiales bacterium]|nr:ABC transporter ATP-binding protein [Parachlamydiales bacterium]
KKALEISNLRFCYKVKQILQDVNLNVNVGDFVGIIGPNGGGKTTLLKLIMGMLSPHTGSIKIFNKKPTEVREKFGYVPQIYHIDKSFPITTLDATLLGIFSKTKFGFFTKKQKDLAKDILEQVGLKDFIKSPFSKLSGGQTQRALIARALISDPEILILDEPTANIDLESEQMIFDLLINSPKKRTILMVSHDLETIIKKVKKIIIVDCKVTTMLPHEVCEHFKIGLYHKPII